MRTNIGVALPLLAGVLGSAEPAMAQQTLSLTLGYFTVKGEDSRADNDVLVANREFLTFDTKEFNGATIGGEWLVGLGPFLEAGAGASFTRKTVPSVYSEFVDDDGGEIEQDLKLRMVPVAFTLRFLPLGDRSPVQPYVGAGLAVINWRYTETGDFINFGAAGRPVFRDSFVADGNETGPVILGGVRFASDTMSAGGEIRYQRATADLDDRFADSKLDLGGWTYQVTLGARFGN